VKRLVLTAAVMVVAGLAVSGREDRGLLSVVFGAAALVTVALGLIGSRLTRRLRSLTGAMQWVAIGSVGVAALTVLLATQTMVLDPHDRDLVLVALGLGVGLGLALALAVAEDLTADLGRIRDTVGRVAAGDFTARTAVARADELGTAAGAIDEMVARLQATEAERSFFLAAVGHDLRTPLTSIRAALEAIIDGVAPDPAAYLSGMRTDIGHLAGLVEDLFVLSRLEAGRFVPAVEDVDLAELADETAEAMNALAAAAGVELVVNAPGRVPAAVDPAAIGRVLRNLVDNALEHTPAGSRVTITVRPGLLRVRDEGRGFPPGFGDRAFDRFSRADPARAGGGAGLGLAIAKGIVEAHGGRITIEDGPGGSVAVGLPAPSPAVGPHLTPRR
jgi:two-component system sensor histidine kinase BaeS